MTCARYGVAVTTIQRVRDTQLVRNPENGAEHLICSGDLDYALKLCASMRSAQNRYQVPQQAIAYTVVPLPVTAMEVITSVRW